MKYMKLACDKSSARKLNLSIPFPKAKLLCQTEGLKQIWRILFIINGGNK